VSYTNLNFGFKARKFLAGLHRDPLLRNQRWLGSFLPEELPALLRGDFDADGQRALELLLTSPAAADPAERLLRADQRFYMAEQVLMKTDRASMANSLEVRVPFLDRTIVSLARSLPFEYKLHGGISKRILRATLHGSFSEELVKRPKKGFGAPLGSWFRGELRDFIGDELSVDRIREQGFFSPDDVQKLLANHWRGRADERKKLFNLLAFTLWYDYARNQLRLAERPQEARVG
jgi:asparagine synthase (glutamine-hydrolysing)